MNTLITGSAGFIGFHLSKTLLQKGYPVIGVDNLNSYYDPKLKESRLAQLEAISKISKTPFIFIKANIEDNKSLEEIFIQHKPNKVFHLAAQAGVRYSIENPSSYIQSNLVGFGNILERCRQQKVEHLIYASSSSVYGGNTNLPFIESQGVDHPVSLYAATKKSNELMAHSYSHLYNLPITGVRFFTIYGPWGRPDMALFLFTKAILENKKIKVFNNGEMLRDFTYIDDSIECLTRLIDKPPFAESDFDTSLPNPSKSWAPYRIFNLGNSNPVRLSILISTLEEKLEIKAKKEFLPMQPGDVVSTFADTNALKDWIGITPKTSIEIGIKNFVIWYRSYYNC
tara:strand:+ start:5579 stop:6601 length:1023 start_codon:yes stop_codon:yes gene_type:complete